MAVRYQRRRVTLNGVIASLHVYPVKSCRGIACNEVVVRSTGLAVDGVRDREWMIVDALGRFVTQRELPQLALIDVGASDGQIVLRMPGVDAVAPDIEGPICDVGVWRSKVRGYDGGDAVADALYAYTGRKLRLVRFDDAKPRRVNPDYAGDSGATTLFSDGYPILVIGRASLDDLNDRLATNGSIEMPMNRFRPNIVIDGLDAFDEDHAQTLTIGNVVLKPVKPCVRCEITTTDQDTGHRGIEPLRTLSTFRRDDRLAGVTFGMNAIVAAGAGDVIAVGNEVETSLRF
ncbi:MAG TPA: MOSC N-terminal beta barrel domain-containing protein [Casimicrobiaceae bacterium]|nr:MOSC N-terminal beta barrel domain-containing protein [Casimicrobiaceae bacterium]